MTKSATSSVSAQEILIIVLFAIAAYGLTAIHYQPFADDLMVTTSGPERLLNPSQDGMGLWRILGSFVIGTGLRLSPSVGLFGIVLIHSISGCLLLRILRQLGVGTRLSLLFTVAYITLPWYHEAIAWAAANCYILSTAFFLVTLTLALDAKPGDTPPTRLCGTLFFLTFIGNLFCEQLAFAFMALPLLVILWRDGFPRHLSGILGNWPLLGATAGAALYILLFLLTTEPGSAKDAHLNPGTLLSAFYYQYVSLAAYHPWCHIGQLGNLFVSRINVPLLLTVGVLPAIIALIPLYRQLTIESPVALTNRHSLSSVTVAGLILLVSIVIVFVVGGGYSLDSRKRYDILLGLTIALAPLLARLQWKAPRWIILFALAFITLNIATTNLLTAIYKTEVIRAQRLVQSPEIAQANRIYHLEPYVGREKLWRSIRPYWEGFYLDILLPPALKGPATAPRVYFDLKQDRWIFEE